MFTKCMTCRKWAECPYCGTCHACRPDVAAACAAYRAVKGREAAIHTQVARKHQASTYTQDPGLGANGCEPRVTARHHNWYGSADYREWARAERDARRNAEAGRIGQEA